MAITKEKFLAGEECGTFKEAVKKSVLEFLHENPNRAYSFVEINSKFSVPMGGITAPVVAVSALDELVEEKKVTCKKIRKKLYYALR
jgi:hypothetical protein